MGHKARHLFMKNRIFESLEIKPTPSNWDNREFTSIHQVYGIIIVGRLKKDDGSNERTSI